MTRLYVVQEFITTHSQETQIYNITHLVFLNHANNKSDDFGLSTSNKRVASTESSSMVCTPSESELLLQSCSMVRRNKATMQADGVTC